MHAYCWASGLIEFGTYVPDGAISIVEGKFSKLKPALEALPRHGAAVLAAVAGLVWLALAAIEQAASSLLPAKDFCMSAPFTPANPAPATLITEAPAHVQLDDQIAELERETARRARAYRDAIGWGPLHAAVVAQHNLRLGAALTTLQSLRHLGRVVGLDYVAGAPAALRVETPAHGVKTYVLNEEPE